MRYSAPRRPDWRLKKKAEGRKGRVGERERERVAGHRISNLICSFALKAFNVSWVAPSTFSPPPPSALSLLPQLRSVRIDKIAKGAG